MPLNGARVRDLRDRKRLSQDDVAKAVGVTRQQVTRWEGGHSDPAGDYIMKLATVSLFFRRREHLAVPLPYHQPLQ